MYLRGPAQTWRHIQQTVDCEYNSTDTRVRFERRCGALTMVLWVCGAGRSTCREPFAFATKSWSCPTRSWSAPTSVFLRWPNNFQASTDLRSWARYLARSSRASGHVAKGNRTAWSGEGRATRAPRTAAATRCGGAPAQRAQRESCVHSSTSQFVAAGNARYRRLNRLPFPLHRNELYCLCLYGSLLLFNVCCCKQDALP